MPTFASLLADYLNAPQGLGLTAVLFFAMAIGHAVADYPLQGQYLARTKDPKGRNESLGEGKNDWILSLNAHCLIHGGMVWLITGVVWYGLVEWLLHLIVDYLKIRELTSLAGDQLLHFACKLVYAVVIGYALI